VAVSDNTWYYCTCSRVGTTFKNHIYSDEARTTEIVGSPVSVTCNTVTYQYLFPVNNSNSGHSTAELDAWIKNLDIQEEEEEGANLWLSLQYRKPHIKKTTYMKGRDRIR